MPKKIIFTDIEINNIIDLYINKRNSLAKISKIIKRDIDIIRRVLCENNIPLFKPGELKRRYNFDFTFFEQIDTPAKAQILGMIAADGYVNKSTNSFGKMLGTYVSIGIKNSDEKYLNDIKKEIKYDGPIRYNKNNAVLCICSNKIVNDLNNLGIVNKKSLILDFPSEKQVPPYLIRDFIRGYFDGDGGISLDFKERKFTIDYHVGCISLALTKNFGIKAKEIIEKELNIYCTLKADNQNDSTRSPIWSLLISGNKQVLKFLNWIYQDACFVMDRKYERYQILLKENEYRLDNRKNIYKLVAQKRNDINIKARADKMKVTIWLKKDSQIYKIRSIWGFVKEYNLCRAHLYKVINKIPKYISHKGWSLYEVETLGIPSSYIELNY